jgi:YD repeat-containing protein
MVGKLLCQSGQPVTPYSYDDNGNRTMSGYTTGTGNELTSDGTYDYTYDASGEEITKTDIATGDKWTYGYNAGGELISAEEQTALGAIEQEIDYDYDVLGQLIETQATVGDTTTTRYAVDGWNPLL